jgi:hypothetical protein
MKVNSNELVVANREDNYPAKIKKIQEELRVSKELT